MAAAEVVVEEAADGEAVSAAVGPPAGRAARVVDAVISGYQALRMGRPSPCRFAPSCSSYAREAVATHGVGRGSWLALRRLGRCRPGGGHGWDPVPEPGLTSRMMGEPDDGDPPARTAG